MCMLGFRALQRLGYIAGIGQWKGSQLSSVLFCPDAISNAMCFYTLKHLLKVSMKVNSNSCSVELLMKGWMNCFVIRIIRLTKALPLTAQKMIMVQLISTLLCNFSCFSSPPNDSEMISINKVPRKSVQQNLQDENGSLTFCRNKKSSSKKIPVNHSELQRHHSETRQQWMVRHTPFAGCRGVKYSHLSIATERFEEPNKYN